MIADYSVYELSRKQTILFCLAGYGVLFTVFFLFYRSAVVSALAGGLVWFLRPRFASLLAERRRQELLRQFKDMLYSLSASVTAGRQMGQALIEAFDNLSAMYPPDSPIMGELAAMKRSLTENNAGDAELLVAFAERSGCEDIRSFVQVYLTCRSTGGDLEKVIASTAKILMDKMEISEEIAVLTAQKKLEGRIISLMPPAMILFMNLLSPAYIQPLYATAAGRIVMTLCLCGTFAGVRMMEKLTDVEI